MNNNINYDPRGSIAESDASSKIHAASIANSDHVAPLLDDDNSMPQMRGSMHMMDIVEEGDEDMGFGARERNTERRRFSVRNEEEIQNFKQNRMSVMSKAQIDSEAV